MRKKLAGFRLENTKLFWGGFELNFMQREVPEEFLGRFNSEEEGTRNLSGFRVV